MNPFSEDVDYALIGGKRTPGTLTLEGVNSPRQWDERRGFGYSGATLIFRRVGLSRFTARIILVTEEDFEDWDLFRPTVAAPPRGERARALDFWHPIAEDNEIHAVVVEDVVAPHQTADGEWTVEIRLIEFARPQLALARPNGTQDRPLTAEQITAVVNGAIISARLAERNGLLAFGEQE